MYDGALLYVMFLYDTQIKDDVYDLGFLGFVYGFSVIVLFVEVLFMDFSAWYDDDNMDRVYLV